jgi:uncharacterized RDD family membrane protein YckC
MSEQTPLDLRGGFDIETPEQVAFRLERAGMGARSLAALIDTVILGVLYFLGMIGAGAGIGFFGVVEEEAPQWIVALMIVTFTFLIWAYYIGFELAWNGQTPGKRLLSIRVTGDAGVPVTPAQVVIRNLMRLIDVQFAYAVGLIAMFASREEKRLGDMAAGTVVVSERRRPRPHGPRGAATHSARSVDPRLLDLVRDYWARSPELDQRTRYRIARELANRLAEELGRPPVAANRVVDELHEMTELLLQKES